MFDKNDDETESEDFIPNLEEELEEVSDSEEEGEISIHELLFNELTELLLNEANKKKPALTAWLIGDRLRRTLGIITDDKVAKSAFDGLQVQISDRFGSEYSSEKLYTCLKLADDFPDLTIFEDYSLHLSLEHFLLILEIDSDMARTFYCEMSKLNKWSVSDLRSKIEAKLFESEFGEG